MGVIKTTIAIDEEVWKEFNRSVFCIYECLRMTNRAVEEAIKCFNAIELLKGFSKAIDLLRVHTSWSGGRERGA